MTHKMENLTKTFLLFIFVYQLSEDIDYQEITSRLKKQNNLLQKLIDVAHELTNYNSMIIDRFYSYLRMKIE